MSQSNQQLVLSGENQPLLPDTTRQDAHRELVVDSELVQLLRKEIDGLHTKIRDLERRSENGRQASKAPQRGDDFAAAPSRSTVLIQDNSVARSEQYEAIISNLRQQVASLQMIVQLKDQEDVRLREELNASILCRVEKEWIEFENEPDIMDYLDDAAHDKDKITFLENKATALEAAVGARYKQMSDLQTPFDNLRIAAIQNRDRLIQANGLLDLYEMEANDEQFDSTEAFNESDLPIVEYQPIGRYSPHPKVLQHLLNVPEHSHTAIFTAAASTLREQVKPVVTASSLMCWA